MIAVRDLCVTYAAGSDHPVRALRHISLDIQSGEFVLITGPSGCGKSTLALYLAGLIPQHLPAQVSGQVTIHHETASARTPVGIVFQTPGAQLFQDTVAEELAFGPRNLGWAEPRIRDHVHQAAQALEIEHLLPRAVRELSGGEQQRVAIAAILSMAPNVLVLDEPLASLDQRGAQDVLNALARLHAQGITILLIEHRLDAVSSLAPRTILMQDGRMVADGPTLQVLQGSQLEAIGLCYPRPTCSAPLGQRNTLSWDAPSPILTLDNIHVSYGDRRVLCGLDLDLYAGETVAIIGDNGAGKTTLCRVLTGLVKPRAGHIRWSTSLRPQPLPRRVGLLSQHAHQQVLCDTVGEEVAYGPTNMRLDNGESVETLLARADLAGLHNRAPHSLSVGQLERCALAAAAALEPHLLILDEPTQGQDWGHLCAMMDDLSKAPHHQTILLITHDCKLVDQYATRILRLAQGKLVPA